MADIQQQLVDAIRQQTLEGVIEALAAGADPNSYFENKSMLALHDSAAGLLLNYLQPTWLAILEALLLAGADANRSCNLNSEEYLLHFLSQHSSLSAMRLLLEHGANPNLLCEGETALDWLTNDYSYEETCNIPNWYKGRVLPEYEATQADLDDYEACAIWLVARHQRGWAMIRQAGGLYSWEMNEGPVSERLVLYPAYVGGLYTQHARPDADFLATLGSELVARIGRWTANYKNPDMLGYEAQAVKAFDYARHMAEGMAIGEAIAPHLPEGVALELMMPTAESIAANSTLQDVHTWNRQSRQWQQTLNWRGTLKPEWFGPEPTCRMKKLNFQ